MKRVDPLALFRNVLKTNLGRFLGLDVGHESIGVAISDPSNRVAFPVRVIRRTNYGMATEFQDLVRKFSVSGLVIGYPYKTMEKIHNDPTVNGFVTELCKSEKLNDMQYTFCDDRYSTETVDDLLKPLHLDEADRKSKLSIFAATVKLQRFIDYVNKREVP